MLVDLPRATASNDKKTSASPTLAIVTPLVNVHAVTIDGIYCNYRAAHVADFRKSPNLLHVVGRYTRSKPAGDLDLSRAAAEQ